MALVDNLLLQKAAGSAPSTYEQSGIELRLPTWQQQLPSNYVGTFNANGTVGAFSSNFSYILHDYASNGAFIQADSFACSQSLPLHAQERALQECLGTFS